MYILCVYIYIYRDICIYIYIYIVAIVYHTIVYHTVVIVDCILYAGLDLIAVERRGARSRGRASDLYCGI